MATLNPKKAAANPRLSNTPQNRNKLANPRTKAVGKAQCLTGFLWQMEKVLSSSWPCSKIKESRFL